MSAAVDENEVTVMLRLRFRPNTMETVLAELLPSARLTREEVGNIEFDVYKERDEDDRLVIFERWVDQAALERHWQEEHTKRTLALFEANLLTPLSEKNDVTYIHDLLGGRPDK